MSSRRSIRLGTRNLDGAQAVEQVLAETAGRDLGAQVAVGRGDQPDLDVAHLRRTDALDFAVLDHAQQFGLHGHGGFAHFVEKNRASIGVFKQARASVRGAGERAADVPEELAFEQRIHDRGTVAHGEPLGGDGTHLVDGVGDEFLARSGRAGKQDVGVMVRDLSRPGRTLPAWRGCAR